MSDYTPVEEEVREAWAQEQQEVDWDGSVIVSNIQARAQFDRFLAKVKADAVREVQANVRASSFWADGSDNYADRVRGYLSSRADRIERGDA